MKKTATDATRPAVLARIAELEAAGRFDEHTDPVDMSIAMPVTPDFPYVRTAFRDKCDTFFRRHFVVYPFTRKVCRKDFDLQIKGKENLRGVGAAIVTCNHFTKFDCLAVQYALRPNRPFVVAAHFNNMRGSFGDAMRAGGMLPMGSGDLATTKAFLFAVRHYLTHGKRVLVYPEQAMWWFYRKPRPMKDGAFDLAVRNGVPVLPLFITMRPSGNIDDNGIEYPYLTLHIMPPITAPAELGFKDKVRFLREANERLCREKYREVYGEEPTYACGNWDSVFRGAGKQTTPAGEQTSPAAEKESD